MGLTVARLDFGRHGTTARELRPGQGCPVRRPAGAGRRRRQDGARSSHHLLNGCPIHFVIL